MPMPGDGSIRADIESMAKSAAGRMPISRRNKPVAAGIYANKPGMSTGSDMVNMPGMRKGYDQPQTVGIEAGTEKTAVAAPGKPVVEKSKEYVKPFQSRGNPTPRGAMQRALGKMY